MKIHQLIVELQCLKMKAKNFFVICLIILASIEEGDFLETEDCEGKECNDKKVKQCEPGFWGEPCKKCECDGRADTCDYATGKCFCNSKGVIGDKCDKCDEKKLYKGDPIAGNCYYELDALNYVFKLESVANKNVKNIHFKFSPEDPKDNIKFTINCSENCDLYEIKMSVKETGKYEKVIVERQTIEGKNLFEKVLSHKDFRFGLEKDIPFSEFFISVAGFKTPIVFNVKVIPESNKSGSIMTFFEAWTFFEKVPKSSLTSAYYTFYF